MGVVFNDKFMSRARVVPPKRLCDVSKAIHGPFDPPETPTRLPRRYFRARVSATKAERESMRKKARSRNYYVSARRDNVKHNKAPSWFIKTNCDI